MNKPLCFLLAFIAISFARLSAAPCTQAAADLQRLGIISSGNWRIQFLANGTAHIAAEKSGLGIPSFPNTSGVWACSGEAVYLTFKWRSSVKQDCTSTCSESAFSGPSKDIDANFKECFRTCETSLFAMYGKKAFEIPISMLFRKATEQQKSYCITSQNRFDTSPIPGHTVYEFPADFAPNECF